VYAIPVPTQASPPGARIGVENSLSLRGRAPALHEIVPSARLRPMTDPRTSEPSSGSLAPVAWFAVGILATAHFLVHVLTNGNYGMFRDEFYYLACADHLAWGYVDHPPFSIAVLALWRAIFGDSVQAIRILPALMGAALVVLTALTARELGGRRMAQTLAALAAAVAPTWLGITGFYSMNAFELVVWTGALLVYARILRGGDRRLWLALGVILGIGLLNKISVLVLGTGIAVGVLLGAVRHDLRRPEPWLAAGIALLLFAPYLIWQVANDWPTREFVANAQRYKIADLSPAAFFGEQILMIHPQSLPLWLAGLWFLMYTRRMKTFRPLGLVYLVAFIIFVMQKSKPYYLTAAYAPLLAAGACAAEAAARRKLGRWLVIVYGVTLAAGGAMIAPLAVPILPVEKLIRHQARIGIGPQSAENNELGALPQYYADRFGWEEMTAEVARVYDALAPEERERCAIVCMNYGEAGAITYYGRKLGLPPAVSQHNSYYLWGPGREEIDVVIAVGFDEEELRGPFASVEAAGHVLTRYAMPYESNLTIWVARGLTVPLADAWRAGKHYI